jgi:hypothetical protein
MFFKYKRTFVPLIAASNKVSDKDGQIGIFSASHLRPESD